MGFMLLGWMMPVWSINSTGSVQPYEYIGLTSIYSFVRHGGSDSGRISSWGIWTNRIIDGPPVFWQKNLIHSWNEPYSKCKRCQRFRCNHRQQQVLKTTVGCQFLVILCCRPWCCLVKLASHQGLCSFWLRDGCWFYVLPFACNLPAIIKM